MMKRNPVLKILPAMLACFLLLACGGSGGSGGGGSQAPDDRKPIVTSIMLVDNDNDSATPVPASQAAIRISADEQVGNAPLIVRAGVSVGSEAEVIVSLTIPAGQSEALATLTELDIDLSSHTSPVEIALTVKESAENNYTINLTQGLPAPVSVEPDMAEDPPTIEIRASGTSIAEDDSSGKLTFTFVASKPSNEDLTINFMVEETGDMIAADSEGAKTITLPANQKSVEHDIPLVNDNIDESDSIITATVTDGENYSVLLVRRSAAVSVSDDDEAPQPPATAPTVSLPTGNSSSNPIALSDLATDIIITTPSALASPVTVVVGITVGNTPETIVSVPMGMGDTEEAVPFGTRLDGLAAGQTHAIMIRIIPEQGNPNYVASSETPVTYHVAIPAPAPTVSLSPGNTASSPIAESDVATSIKITTPNALAGPITVMVGVTVGSNMEETVSVPMAMNDTEESVPFGTILTDLTAGATYEIMVRILPDTSNTSYVASSSAAVTYHVAIHLISIVPVAIRINEGEANGAQFTITATPSPTAALDVMVSVSETGDVIKDPIPQMVSVPPDSQNASSAAVLTVMLDDDNVNEAKSTITATLTTGTGYRLGNNVSSPIEVSDNDEITIGQIKARSPLDCGSDTNLLEGCPVSLVATVDDFSGTEWTRNLTVNLNLTGTATGKLSITPTSGTLKPSDLNASREATIATIDTTCVASAESGGALMLVTAVQAGDGYTAANVTHSVTMDDVHSGGSNTTCPANRYVASIEQVVTPVIEADGASITYKAKIDRPVELNEDPLAIFVNFEEVGEFVTLSAVSSFFLIQPGESEGTISVPITNNTRIQTGNSLTIKIDQDFKTRRAETSSATDIQPEYTHPERPAERYYRHASQSSATAYIIDDEEIRLNSISAVRKTDVDGCGISDKSPGGADNLYEDCPVSITVDMEDWSARGLSFPGMDSALSTFPIVFDITIESGANLFDTTPNNVTIRETSPKTVIRVSKPTNARPSSTSTKTVISLDLICNDSITTDTMISIALVDVSTYKRANNVGSTQKTISNATCPAAQSPPPPGAQNPDRTQPGSQWSAELHREILPELFGTTSTQSMDTVSERIDFAFNNPGTIRLELNGAGSPDEVIRSAGEMMNSGDLSWENVMKGSSFSVPLSSSETGVPLTLWGSGFGEDVSNDRNSIFSWNGDTAMRHLGLDAAIGNGLLLGISSSSDESTVGFQLGEYAGRYDVRMTSFNPYLAWSNHDLTTRFKVSAGYGTGEVEIDFDNHLPITAPSNQFSVLMGFKHELASFNSLNGITGQLELDTEIRSARQFVSGNDDGMAGATASNRNLKASIDGKLDRMFHTGSVLSPQFSIGIDLKGGDYDPGADTDFASGVEFSSPTGFGVSGMNYIQVSGDSDRKHSLEGALNYDLNSDNLGMLLNSSFRYDLTEEQLSRILEVGYGFMAGSKVLVGLTSVGNNNELKLNSTVDW